MRKISVSVCMFSASLVKVGIHLYALCIVGNTSASAGMFSASLVTVGHSFLCLVHRWNYLGICLYA